MQLYRGSADLRVFFFSDLRISEFYKIPAVEKKQFCAFSLFHTVTPAESHIFKEEYRLAPCCVYIQKRREVQETDSVRILLHTVWPFYDTVSLRPLVTIDRFFSHVNEYVRIQILYYCTRWMETLEKRVWICRPTSMMTPYWLRAMRSQFGTEISCVFENGRVACLIVFCTI